MEIISLLPFFIFLLFVFLTIYRTKQRLKNLAKSKNIRLKPEESGKEKKSGWKNILIDAYEQIQREIKAAQEKKQAKYDKSEKEALIPSPPPIPLKEIKKKKTAPAPRKPESVKVQESKDVKPHLPLIQKPTVQDLRKAIVWSEILGPPIALRENQDIF